MTSSIVTSIFHFGCCKETLRCTGTLIIHSAPLGRSRNTYLNIILDVESIQTWTWTCHFGCQSQSFRSYGCQLYNHPGPWVCHICKYCTYIYIYHPFIYWAVDKCIVLNINTLCKSQFEKYTNTSSKRTRKLRDVEVQLLLVGQWTVYLLCPLGGFKHVLVT